MTAALEGGEWSAARHGRTLPPGKTGYPFYRRLGGPQGRSGRAENLVSTGIGSRTVQPVVSCYTDWATGTTSGQVPRCNGCVCVCSWICVCICVYVRVCVCVCTHVCMYRYGLARCNLFFRNSMQWVFTEYEKSLPETLPRDAGCHDVLEVNCLVAWDVVCLTAADANAKWSLKQKIERTELSQLTCQHVKLADCASRLRCSVRHGIRL